MSKEDQEYQEYLDKAAIAAMQGIRASGGGFPADIVAHEAYKQADAMLGEKKRRAEGE